MHLYTIFRTPRYISFDEKYTVFRAGSDSAPLVVVAGDGGESLGVFLFLL